MSFCKKIIVSLFTWKISAFSFLIIAAAFFLFLFLVPSLGKFLIITKPLRHADVLVVMAGEASIRLPAAARMYREKVADKIILTNDGIFSSWSDEKQRNLYEVEWAELSLMKMQVPKKAIVKLPYSSSGSIHDSLNTRTYIKDNGIKSIIIVTSDYHTKRSLWIFEKAFRKDQVEIGVYPVKASLLERSFIRGRVLLLTEFVKYMYYYCKYNRL